MIVLKARGPAGSRVVALGLLMLLATLLMAAGISVVGARSAEAATTFTVNKTGDAKDRTINGVCDSSRDRGKQCTLRAAIQEANATAGADTINFNIVSTANVKTISPASKLPTITEAVTIDGYTQPGASANTLAEGNDAVLKVQLNGTNAGTNTIGLEIRSANSTIKGLVINRFGNEGVRVILPGATGNKVEGNFIGTNAAGTTALGNGIRGVGISNAPGNIVGGTQPDQRNVISGNGIDGVAIGGSESTGNEILGNFVGTDDAGTANVGNGNDGVVIASSAENNTVGGTVSGARNVLSGNGDDGIEMRDDTLSNDVLGNFIGTNAAGTAALGNSGDGVDISNADDNTVGGTVSGARNVISGNSGDGVVLFGTGATGNKVEGNFIGTDAAGTAALGNDDGVVFSSANGSTIGGTASGAGNRIAHNQQDGVLVFGGAAVGNSVLSNSIFANGELGIDLASDEVTANDLDDPDSPTSNNRRQNFPVITSAIRSNTTTFTTITGTLNSNPSQSFTIQCFVAGPGPFAALDPSGHGEGQILAGEDTTVTTDAGGDASFQCVSPIPQLGQAVTATATNTATGDTSEFSLNVGVVAGL